MDATQATGMLNQIFANLFSIQIIVSFILILFGLYAKVLAANILAYWSAKQFFGTGPNTWLKFELNGGKFAIGEVKRIGLNRIEIQMSDNTVCYIPTINFETTTWFVLQKDGLIECGASKELEKGE